MMTGTTASHRCFFIIALTRRPLAAPTTAAALGSSSSTAFDVDTCRAACHSGVIAINGIAQPQGGLRVKFGGRLQALALQSIHST